MPATRLTSQLFCTPRDSRLIPARSFGASPTGTASPFHSAQHGGAEGTAFADVLPNLGAEAADSDAEQDDFDLFDTMRQIMVQRRAGEGAEMDSGQDAASERQPDGESGDVGQ